MAVRVDELKVLKVVLDVVVEGKDELVLVRCAALSGSSVVRVSAGNQETGDETDGTSALARASRRRSGRHDAVRGGECGSERQSGSRRGSKRVQSSEASEHAQEPDEAAEGERARSTRRA